MPIFKKPEKFIFAQSAGPLSMGAASLVRQMGAEVSIERDLPCECGAKFTDAPHKGCDKCTKHELSIKSSEFNLVVAGAIQMALFVYSMAVQDRPARR